MYYVRRYAVFARYVLLGVDIDLDKLQLSWLALFLGETLEDGGNHFAGAAPVSVEVDYGVC